MVFEKLTENPIFQEALIDDLSDKGQPIKRPGKLIDRLPSPYPNKIAAEAANIGKYPPDFSTIMLARRPHGFAPRFNTNSNEDYIFSILTGTIFGTWNAMWDKG